MKYYRNVRSGKGKTLLLEWDGFREEMSTERETITSVIFYHALTKIFFIHKFLFVLFQ
jgi:hypothetical protein